MFPNQRLRRNRNDERIRGLLAESRPEKSKMIMPVFVSEEASDPEPISGMKRIFRYPLSLIGDYCKKLDQSGLGGILLFGVPSRKDEIGSEAYNDNGVVQNAIREMQEFHFHGNATPYRCKGNIRH